MRACAATAMMLLSFLSGCQSSAERQSLTDYHQAQTQYFSATQPAGQPANQSTADALPSDPTLSDYLVYAAVNNPGLEAAFNRWKAALERIPQARALPDPQFTYRYFIVPQMMRDGDMRNVFEIAQTFPWLGKLQYRQDVAVQEARQQQQMFEAERLKLVDRVKEAYYEYYYLGRSLAISRENLQQLRFIEGISRARYRTAGGSAPDVLRAQVELGRSENDLASLEDLQAASASKLNAALNLPQDYALPLPTELAGQEEIPSDAALLQLLQQHNPDLAAAQAAAARERESINLARQDYFPDVMLGFEYDQMTHGRGLEMSPENPYAIMLSVNVPIWCEKYSAGVREATARHWAAAQTKMELANSLSADLKMSAYNFRNAQRKIALYRDTLIPRAKQSLNSVQAAYQTGATTFSDLIDSQRILLDLELGYERALADRQQSLAKLEMLVGISLGSTPCQVESQPSGNPAP